MLRCALGLLDGSSSACGSQTSELFGPVRLSPSMYYASDGWGQS